MTPPYFINYKYLSDTYGAHLKISFIRILFTLRITSANWMDSLTSFSNMADNTKAYGGRVDDILNRFDTHVGRQ